MRVWKTLLGCVMVVSISASAAQVPGTALCDVIAAQIGKASQSDWWARLTKGEHPFIEVAGESEMRALGFAGLEGAELVNALVVKFNPSDDLRKAWIDESQYGHLDIASLAGSDLHVVTNTDGSALCVSFMFFQTPKGRPAQLLPDLPKKGDRDGDNLICIKYGSDGYLARVGGVEAFLETHDSEDKAYLRVVPLREGRWGNACAVDAEFRTTYGVSRVFVPEKGPLTEADLTSAASQILVARGAVKDAGDFSFGARLSQREEEEVRAMTDLLAKMGEERVPAFGRDNELAPGEDKLASGDSFGVVLNGHAYLLRLGEGQLGCCYFPGPILILYTLENGKLNPVGSAILEKSRGALESVRAGASR